MKTSQPAACRGNSPSPPPRRRRRGALRTSRAILGAAGAAARTLREVGVDGGHDVEREQRSRRPGRRPPRCRATGGCRRRRRARARSAGCRAASTSVVIRIGRRRARRGVEHRLAQRAGRRRWRWLANSTIRMPFFVTRPISMMMPIWLNTLSVWPKTSRLASAPASESGTVTRMIDRIAEALELRRQHQVDEHQREREGEEQARAGVGEVARLAGQAGADRRAAARAPRSRRARRCRRRRCSRARARPRRSRR